MDENMARELAGWAVHFTRAVKKVKECADQGTGSETTLSHEECKALKEGLQVAFRNAGA